jgi:hypothetical protein
MTDKTELIFLPAHASNTSFHAFSIKKMKKRKQNLIR